MSSNFQITFKRSNGNLHVNPRGDFDGISAWQLINLLYEKYDGKGRVFIHTQHLRKVCPFGCSTFKCRLNLSRVPARRLFFKGEKGFEIAPRGSKVIRSPDQHPCRCNGDCAHCPCAEERNPDKAILPDSSDGEHKK